MFTSSVFVQRLRHKKDVYFAMKPTEIQEDHNLLWEDSVSRTLSQVLIMLIISDSVNLVSQTTDYRVNPVDLVLPLKE